MAEKIDLVLEKLGTLQDDVSGLKKDMSGVKKDVIVLKKDVSGLKKDIGVLKKDVGELSLQQKENTAILRSLESAKDIHKAQLDNIENKLSHFEGVTKSIKHKSNIALDLSSQNRIDLRELSKVQEG